MALSTAEISRIKFELGYNVLTLAAEPWIGVSAIFENIVQVYLQAGAATTSATAVTAADAPTPVAITLASATGVAAGARIWVDVDDRLESATIQSLSGAVVTVALSKAHSGTYPVYVDGGESIVRELLDRIKATKTELGSIFGEGALKKVDEIEWYNPMNGKTLFGQISDQLMYWRDELASLLGVGNMWRARRSSGSQVAVY